MASSSEPSRKWGREEEDDNESRRCRLVKEGTMMAPEVPEEVPPLPPDEPEEVPPPPVRRARGGAGAVARGGRAYSSTKC
jgi:hypothetical protein